MMRNSHSPKHFHITYKVEVLLVEDMGEYENEREFSVMDTVTSDSWIDRIHEILTPLHISEGIRYRGYNWIDTTTVEEFLEATNLSNNPTKAQLEYTFKRLRLSDDLKSQVKGYYKQITREERLEKILNK